MGAFRVVWCPSCIVNNIFKHLSSQWADLDQTWQECSLGGPLSKLFSEFDSIKNSGCHANKMEFFKQFFRNLLLWNFWSDFEIISQECCLGNPFQNWLRDFDLSINMVGEWGILALYGHKEVLQNSETAPKRNWLWYSQKFR